MSTPIASPRGASAAKPADDSSYYEESVARQPIFDRKKRVYAYELLFRDGSEDAYASQDGTEATRRVLAAAGGSVGMKALVGSKRAAINFTRELLLGGYELALSPPSTIIEIVELVDGDDEVVEACSLLKKQGYILALDDFVYREALEPLIPVVDIVKVRVGECELEEQCDHVRRVSPSTSLLAEKVETQEDYSRALDLGFRYFQGWFFCRPETMTGRSLSGSHLMYLRLIQAVTRAELNFDELEHLIRTDVSLAHRFMKFLGSAAFGWVGPFTSIRHGLALLGESLTRRWVSLISLDQMAAGKPRELLMTAAVRARVCEDLASRIGLDDRKHDLFFLGSLSLIDTMLDRPMAAVLDELSLEEDLQGALLGRSNRLRQVLDISVAYERGEWQRCSVLCSELGVPTDRIARSYADGVSWARDVFSS